MAHHWVPSSQMWMTVWHCLWEKKSKGEDGHMIIVRDSHMVTAQEIFTAITEVLLIWTQTLMTLVAGAASAALGALVLLLHLLCLSIQSRKQGMPSCTNTPQSSQLSCTRWTSLPVPLLHQF